MKSYEKLRRLRDETIFQVKTAKRMIKEYQEEAQGLKSNELATQYLNMRKSNILDKLIEALGDFYEIK